MDKKLFYWARFEFCEEAGLFEVYFVDIPNAVTFGKNMEDAYFMAIDVLAATLADYEEMPKISTHRNLPMTHLATYMLVPVDKDLLAKYKTHVPRGDIVEAYQDAEMKASALKEMLRAV